MRISPLGSGNLPLIRAPQVFKSRVWAIATHQPIHCLSSITFPQGNTDGVGFRLFRQT
ncbi:MAG: hypothetical protein ACRC8Y_09575 [Chroococcales cyanobacterium]